MWCLAFSDRAYRRPHDHQCGGQHQRREIGGNFCPSGLDALRLAVRERIAAPCRPENPAPQERRPWKISASHGRHKIWGGERHVHISRNREQTREYHEIAITSSTRRWNVMAPIGSRSGITFYRYRALQISFYIRPAFDAPLGCVLSSRGPTRRDPCARAIDGDRTHAVVNNDPTARLPLGDSS